MIHGADSQVGTSDRDVLIAQQRKRLRRGHLMDQVQVYVENRRGIRRLVLDEMLGPDLVE